MKGDRSRPGDEHLHDEPLAGAHSQRKQLLVRQEELTAVQRFSEAQVESAPRSDSRDGLVGTAVLLFAHVEPEVDAASRRRQRGHRERRPEAEIRRRNSGQTRDE